MNCRWTRPSYRWCMSQPLAGFVCQFLRTEVQTCGKNFCFLSLANLIVLSAGQNPQKENKFLFAIGIFIAPYHPSRDSLLRKLLSMQTGRHLTTTKCMSNTLTFCLFIYIYLFLLFFGLFKVHFEYSTEAFILFNVPVKFFYFNYYLCPNLWSHQMLFRHFYKFPLVLNIWLCFTPPIYNCKLKLFNPWHVWAWPNLISLLIRNRWLSPHLLLF